MEVKKNHAHLCYNTKNFELGNSLKSTFLWDIWFGRNAVKNIDEMIAGPVNG